MHGVPAELSTEAQPPLALPLRHFLVGLAFLLAGGVAALGVAVGAGSGPARVAALHLLLVGWVGVTILGAVTQFVPVWSGVPLYSDRLAAAQLALVAVGVAGFAGGLWVGRPADAVPFALAMAAGFLVFGYNAVRTLLPARPWDVTERHFALAVGCFALAATVAAALALDFRYAVLPAGGVSRTDAVGAHVTLAVFGGVVSTIAGALAQLGPMFTQTDPGPFDDRLRRVESAALPAGVLALAAGRLIGHAALATAGGLLLAGAVTAVGWLLWRRVRDATVRDSPMVPRYAVVAAAFVLWGVTAGAAWLAGVAGAGVGTALDPALRFGAPRLGAALLFAAVGFVVVGTLYHVVPFLIWVHRYSDRVGLEPVPAIDDLYDARLARLDYAATVGGSLLVAVAAATRPLVGGAVPLGDVAVVGGAVVVAGLAGVVANLVRTALAHAPAATGLPERVLDRG